ncbi:hypothetical protein GCM10009422_01450 [Brevundimonas kwangchunensis]|uniref:Uncharacterized protein n=1 Tax=Brevundimonas kwangchunensis TaxID=322163 RepID=A0ABN1GFA2_9CAUL
MHAAPPSLARPRAWASSMIGTNGFQENFGLAGLSAVLSVIGGLLLNPLACQPARCPDASGTRFIANFLTGRSESVARREWPRDGATTVPYSGPRRRPARISLLQA